MKNDSQWSSLHLRIKNYLRHKCKDKNSKKQRRNYKNSIVDFKILLSQRLKTTKRLLGGFKGSLKLSRKIRFL